MDVGEGIPGQCTGGRPPQDLVESDKSLYAVPLENHAAVVRINMQGIAIRA